MGSSIRLRGIRGKAHLSWCRFRPKRPPAFPENRSRATRARAVQTAVDLSLTPQQLALRDRILHFAAGALNDDLSSRDRDCVFARDSWRKCAEAGILGACIPTAYGGRGYDVVTTIVMLEALGQGCRDNGLTLALNGQMWSIQEPILRFGSEEQKQRFLPRLCSGEWLGAHGMTEPESGSDAFSLLSTAEAVDGGYRLNGRKSYIGLAPEADVSLVFAKTNPTLGA
jgi:alkylation response protein AidB-like acyl-CoA dehydrogenase